MIESLRFMLFIFPLVLVTLLFTKGVKSLIRGEVNIFKLPYRAAMWVWKNFKWEIVAIIIGNLWGMISMLNSSPTSSFESSVDSKLEGSVRRVLEEMSKG